MAAVRPYRASGLVALPGRTGWKAHPAPPKTRGLAGRGCDHEDHDGRGVAEAAVAASSPGKEHQSECGREGPGAVNGHTQVGEVGQSEEPYSHATITSAHTGRTRAAVAPTPPQWTGPADGAAVSFWKGDRTEN